MEPEVNPMRLFHFSITVRDGEHEYLDTLAVRARGKATAQKRANEYAKTYLGSRMKWSERYHCFEPLTGFEYRLVEVSRVSEISEEELLLRITINPVTRAGG